MEASRAELAKQTAELEAWKRDRANFKLNPAAVLEKELGEKWYDTLTQHRLQGAPTGDVIAAELDSHSQALRKELEATKADLQAELKKRDEADAQRQRAEYESSVVAHVKAAAEKYPAIAHFKEEGSVLAEIQAHFQATVKQNPDGTFDPGELLSPDAAADRVEKRIREIAKLGADLHTRLNPPEAPKPLEAPVSKSPRYGVPQRRSLSTEITAPQGSWTPPKDDRERMQRAHAAADRDFEARQPRH